MRHKLVRASEFSGGTGVNATLTRGALHDREEGFLREKCVEMRENAESLRDSTQLDLRLSRCLQFNNTDTVDTKAFENTVITDCNGRMEQ